MDRYIDLEVAKIHLKQVQTNASFESLKTACSDLLQDTAEDIADLGIDMGPIKIISDQQKSIDSRINVLYEATIRAAIKDHRDKKDAEKKQNQGIVKLVTDLCASDPHDSIGLEIDKRLKRRRARAKAKAKAMESTLMLTT